MNGYAISVAGAALPVAACLLICVLIEMLAARERYSLGSRFPGILFLLVTPALVTALVWPLSNAWEALGVPHLFSVRDLHPALSFLILLLVYDLLRYTEHRIEHRFWWPVHAVHHSATELHGANSYAHPLMGLMEFLFVLVPLSLIDNGGRLPLALILAVALQNLIIHSPITLHAGPLRRVIVDSRFHRIHHSLEPRHFGKNFGLVFTIWDQLFGTAYFPAKNEWPATGVADLPPPRTFRDYLLHPLRHLKRDPEGARQVTGAEAS